MKFSFGDIIVTPESHTIEIAGKQKRIEPKLIALLTYLAQNAQQVITRQQITEAVWPNVVVVEESVTQAIFALRNVLNDDAKRPKYIETIPRKGYRFLADVAFTTQSLESQKPITSPQSRTFNISLTVAAALALMCGIIWYQLKPHSHNEIASILPVTKMAGAECCMAINDNHKMAFINVVDQTKDLYIKDLISGIQERITQDDWQKGIPLWLDRNTLVYPRCSNIECQLVRQNLHESPQVIYSTNHYIGEITLAQANANLLIFNEEYEGSEFFSFDLRSGKYEKLRNNYPDLPTHILHPIFSKDGNQLYFVNINPKPVLMVLSILTKKISVINDKFDEINSFSIDSNQQLIIAGAQKSTAGLWALGDTNSEPRLIVRASGDEKLQFPLIDPLENALYYQSVQFDQNIAIATTDTIINDNFSELNSTGIDNLAVFSNDEQFLYFISNRTGFSEVWRHDVNTKRAQPVTHMKLAIMDSVLVSNDGQRFSATYINNSQPMLGIFSVYNGELLASIKSQARPISWSDNDKYIYAKEEKNNMPQLVRYDTQTLAATEIQKNAGLIAQESNNSNSLIFFDFDSNAIVEKNIATGEKKILIKSNEENTIGKSFLRIDKNNTSLFVVKQTDTMHELWQYPFVSKELPPRKLLEFPKRAWTTFINRDGTKVLYDKDMPPSGSIMKINFQ